MPLKPFECQLALRQPDCPIKSLVVVGLGETNKEANERLVGLAMVRSDVVTIG